MTRTRKLLYSVTLVMALLAGLELAARAYQWRRGRNLEDSLFHPCYRPYYFLGTSFRPGSAEDWQGEAGLKINAHGFRGPEISLEKPKDVFRILCLGGSTSHSGNYPGKLAAALSDTRLEDGRRFEVINAAVPTWNTTQSAIQLLTRGVHLKPDVIVVFHAINDAGMTRFHWLHGLPEVKASDLGGCLRRSSQLASFVWNRLERLRAAREHARWLGVASGESPLPSEDGDVDGASSDVFRTNLVTMLAIAKANGAHVVLATMPLNHSDRASRLDNVRAAGAAYYRKLDFLVRRVAEHNEVVRELAAEHGASLYDAAKGPLAGDPSGFVDLCHFTEAGAQAFSAGLADLVRRDTRARRR